MKRMSKNPPKEADDTKARGNYESVEQSALEDVAADDAKEVASTDDDEETGKRNICETCCEPKMRTLLTTHVNVFLYATCFWIQIGVLPYLTKRLGVDPVLYGYLQTTFAVVQLCGGPFYGRFGDIFGGKAALLVAFIAASMAYSLLAVSTSIPLLFLSRVPSVGMHSMQGSQMVITDISSHEIRADALGKLGISYGLGMIVGPFLGGFITAAASEEAAAATAAVGSLLSVALVLAFIPSNTKQSQISEGVKENDDAEKSKGDSSVFNLKKILRLLRIPKVAYLLAIKCICGIPFGIFQSMFSIVAMEYFKLGPKENGIVLSYVGVLSITVQGIGIGLLTKRFKDAILVNWSILVIAVAYLLMIAVTNIYTFCLALIPLVTGGAILQVIITSTITKMVPAHDTGAAIGLSMATHSLIRSLSPTIGGYLFSYFGFVVFGVTGVLINAPLAIFLMVYGKSEF